MVGWFRVPELYVFSQICIVTLMSAQFSLAAKPLGRALLSVETGPSIVAEDGIALRVYCWLAEGSGIFVLADGCQVTLVVFAGSPDGRKEL